MQSNLLTNYCYYQLRFFDDPPAQAVQLQLGNLMIIVEFIDVGKEHVAVFLSAPPRIDQVKAQVNLDSGRPQRKLSFSMADKA
jgi:hypothetical protein